VDKASLLHQMGSHAGALIVIHKSKLLKVGWVGTKWKPTILADRWEVETHHFGGSVGSGNPPFWRIGGKWKPTILADRWVSTSFLPTLQKKPFKSNT